MRAYSLIAAAFILTAPGLAKAQTIFSAMAYRKLNLCYISLNNTSEFKVTKAFVDRIQALAGRKTINVQEFQESGKSPEQTLKTIIEKRIPCDGLVISGHHTGAFGGKNAVGSLNINMLERLACEKDSAWWFASIKSLWLQGCRTLGAVSETDRGEDLADFHANRVYQVRNQDGLQQNEWDLREEFATILDTETPYVARFLKVFFKAKVFGWTETAPGEKNSSDKSLVYHIHNTARILARDRQAFHNGGPFTPSLTAPIAKAYLHAMEVMMNPPVFGISNYASISGWRQHGKPVYEKGIYGLHNSMLNAHRPLSSIHDTTLITSRATECKMRSGGDTREKLASIREVLSSEASIALSFYALRDVVLEVKKSSSNAERSRLERELKASVPLANFLRKKLRNRNLGLSRKIEYYGFFEKITGESNRELADQIRSQAMIILRKVPQSGEYDLRDTKAKIFRSMVESDLLNADEIRDIVMNTEDPAIIQAALSAANECVEANPAFNQVIAATYDAALKKPSTLISDVIFYLMTSQRPFSQSVVVLQDIMKRIDAGSLDKKLWTIFVRHISSNPYATKHLDLNHLLRRAMENEEPSGDFVTAAVHSRVDPDLRREILNKYFKQNLGKVVSASRYSSEFATVASTLSHANVDPKDYPDALDYLKTNFATVLISAQTSSKQDLVRAIHALAIAGDASASIFFIRLIDSIRENRDERFVIWVMGQMLADKRVKNFSIPARSIRLLIDSPVGGGDGAFPILQMLGRLEYSPAVKMELLDKIETKIQDPEHKSFVYLSMAQDPKISDREIKPQLDRFMEPALLQIPYGMEYALAVAALRPNLYDVMTRIRDLERQRTGSPSSLWLGMKTLALCDAKISAGQRSQLWEDWLKNDIFDEDALDVLSPGTLSFIKVKNINNYLDLLRKAVKHPRFNDGMKLDFLEALKENDSNILTSDYAISQEQKNQIREVLSTSPAP